jgi:hypothetical protein
MIRREQRISKAIPSGEARELGSIGRARISGRKLLLHLTFFAQFEQPRWEVRTIHQLKAVGSE